LLGVRVTVATTLLAGLVLHGALRVVLFKHTAAVSSCRLLGQGLFSGRIFLTVIGVYLAFGALSHNIPADKQAYSPAPVFCDWSHCLLIARQTANGGPGTSAFGCCFWPLRTHSSSRRFECLSLDSREILCDRYRRNRTIILTCVCLRSTD